MILQSQSPCLESFALCTVQIHQDRLRCPYLHCSLTRPVHALEARCSLNAQGRTTKGAHPSPSLINVVTQLCHEVQHFTLEEHMHDSWLLLRKRRQQQARPPRTQRATARQQDLCRPSNQDKDSRSLPFILLTHHPFRGPSWWQGPTALVSSRAPCAPCWELSPHLPAG